MPELLFNRLCLVGLGLIGSSLARLMRDQRDMARTVVAYDVSSSVRDRVRTSALPT